jgi:3',5'-cyclic-AMP phosphodiesterase
MMFRYSLSGVLFIIFLFAGCDNPFSYSPFEVNLAARFHNTTAENLERLSALDTVVHPTFKVALVADSHYHFDELREAIDDINKKGEALFVIATGDITENGLKKEYEIFHDIMAHLQSPYLTVIGNHDYLANGGEVYRQMFGAFNYSFTFQDVSFIMFDNVIWESNKAADFQWLTTALAETDETAPVRHKIVFSHIPPFDGQLRDNRELFNSLLLQNGVNVSVHGHKHEYSVTDIFGDGVEYVTVGSPQKRSYAMLTIAQDEIFVEQIPF